MASVRAQRLSEIEHIIVDGGSTDGTSSLLKRSPGIRWLSEEDSGQSHAINKGFDLARGQILGWLNADDVLAPSAMTYILETFHKNPDVGWAYGDCEVTGEEQGTWRAPSKLVVEDFNFGPPIAQPSVYFTEWALRRVGPLDETMSLAMDFDLWLRFLVAGIPSVYIPQTLAGFEVHAASKTGSIPWSEFLIEGARALTKVGRHRAANLMLGRSVAQRLVSDETVKPIRLRKEVGLLQQSLAQVVPELQPSRRLLLVGAKLEAADLELKEGRMTAMRHLISPAVWLTAEARQRATACVRDGLSRSRRKLLRRSLNFVEKR